MAPAFFIVFAASEPIKLPLAIILSPSPIFLASLIQVTRPINIQRITMTGPTRPIASTRELSPHITVTIVITVKITAPAHKGKLYCCFMVDAAPPTITQNDI